MERAAPPARLSFQPADAEGFAAAVNAATPDAPISAADLRRLDAARVPGEHHTRRLAWEGGEVVGALESELPRMDSFVGWLQLVVHTLRPDDAVREALWAEAVATVTAAGAQTAVTRVKEGSPDLPFLLARGWQEHDRMWPSTLDLRALDFAAFADEEARVRVAGFRLLPLTDLGPWDEAQQRRYYDLTIALLMDVPSARRIEPWPFEVWQRRFGNGIEREGLFVAVTPNGEWVGTSQLAQPLPARPGTLHNGLTGVLPAWRGHGLGLALKLAAARAALARDYTHSRTSNHPGNRPMLAINGRLGFVREAATVTLIRSLEAVS
ncbi:GNAT superfamily N-acetyltransferase [Deinococcus sp. HSC-46F16]|uniref:GNAT family N-acetyltransferase n=1 Tax=Deinococcus sp. HSC-46F16 TaxID=2910968 RepID=UPI0020A0F8F1|nr:GNAT family N-acetyltransferase [Deinococcus sp. HSC-46F16]MCP2015782.1 GNAT superfamily N-acetyltransferase [Deinococcus sp. HSC-46F16]